MPTKKVPTKKKAVRSVDDIAEELAYARDGKQHFTEEDKRLTAEFKAALHKAGRRDAGDYKLVPVPTLEVRKSEEQMARAWAEENYCLKTEIDMSKAMKIIKPNWRFEIPAGFTVKEVERVQPKKGIIQE